MIAGSPSRTNVAFTANSLYAQLQDAVDGQVTTPPMRESGSPLAAFAVPADTITFGDGTGYYIAYSEDKNRTAVQLAPPYSGTLKFPNIGRQSAPSTRFAGRHFEGANWTFADGHSKWMKLSQVAKVNRNSVMYLFTIEDDQNW